MLRFYFSSIDMLENRRDISTLRGCLEFSKVLFRIVFTPVSRVDSNSMSVFNLPIGTPARIAEIKGGQQLTRRLLGLGLRVGSEVAVLHHRRRGVVLSAGVTRVALGGGVAEKLSVETLGIDGTGVG